MPLAGITILATAIRLTSLSRQPLWWDEGWSVYFASLPLKRMLAATAVDIHPPLYYALLHWWSSAFGFSPLSLRLLSVLFGVGTVAAVYWLGRLALGRSAALAAGLIAAVSPMLVFYSQEVRMYGLVTLLSTLSWCALVRWSAEGKDRNLWLSAYVATATLALYTEYYAALIWLGQCLYLWLSWRRRKSDRPPVRRFLLAVASPVLLYLPWLAYCLPKLLAYVVQKQAIEGYRALGPLAYLWDYLSAFAAGHRVAPAHPPALYTATALCLLIVAAFGLLSQPRQPDGLALAAGYLGLPLAGGYVVNLVSPFTPQFFERVLLPAAPGLLLLAVAGIGRAWRLRRWAGLGALFLVLLPAANLPFVLSLPRYSERDYRPVFAAVRKAASEQDVILCLHPWQYGYAIAYLPPRLRHPFLAPVAEWQDATTRRDELQNLLRQGRIWFPAHQTLGRILEDEVTTDLDTLSYRGAEGWFGQETLLLAYAAAPGPLIGGSVAAFEGGPRLLSSQFTPQAESGSGAIAVRLTWAGIEPDSGLQASIRLLDAADRLCGSRDFALATSEQHVSLFVPWGTPATNLRLVLVVRRGATELHPESEPPGKYALTLGRVSVTPPAGQPPSPADLGLSGRPAGSAMGLDLIGHAPVTASVVQGQDLTIVLWWSCRGTPAKEYVLFLQALSRDGTVVAASEERVTMGSWPMTEWPPGTIVSDEHHLLIPARAPAADLRLVAGLLDPVDRKPVDLGGRKQVNLGAVRVTQPVRNFTDPGEAVVSGVRFADLGTLVGYDVQGCTMAEGLCRLNDSRLRLKLVWRAENESGVRYRSFVHVLCDGTMVAQSDHDPGGTLTTAWLPGQFVVDVHELELPPEDTCPGRLTLAVGLYNPQTGSRLSPASAEASDGRLQLFALTR